MSNNIDLESSDLHNKNIQINTDDINTKKGPNKNSNSSSNEEGNPNGNSNKFIENQKQAVAASMVQSATERITKSWYEKCLCGLDFLKQYFDVTTADVRSRLLHSLVPFNPKFFDISEKSPDLYGPFWIYTTLVFIIAAAGSLARYIQKQSTTNFFQEFVPISAAVIYGIGFGLPLILTILMKCFGSSTSFISVLCTYGYSYSIFIPIIIACAAPINIVQWVLLGYGVFSSTSLILVNYWKELSKYLDKKRYLIIIIVIACQAGLFIVLKFYFFEKFTTTVFPNNTIDNNTNKTNTNSTQSSNKTNLLF